MSRKRADLPQASGNRPANHGQQTKSARQRL